LQIELGACQMIDLTVTTGTATDETVWAGFFDTTKKSIATTDWLNPEISETISYTTSNETGGLYYFKVDPPQGFGFQRVYTDDRSLDEAYVIENDTFVMIPRGYHPVSAAPGYRIYYLWVLAGGSLEMAPRDDPDHQWVLEAG